MAKFLGRFYFKQTSNGNLLGEFANSGMKYVGTESAILQNETEGTIAFAGEYDTCWIEDSVPTYARLIISCKDPYYVYKVEWRNDANKVIFVGEATLCDGMLVGAYDY